MNIVTDVILPLALAFIMFVLGLGLTGADFLRVIKQPRDFFVGAFSQIILLPIIAFILVKIWPIAPELAIGVMIIAAAPGGVTSNLLTSFAKGDVALSISLTAIISLLCVITIPFIVLTSVELLGGSNITQDISLLSMSLDMFLIVRKPLEIIKEKSIAPWEPISPWRNLSSVLNFNSLFPKLNVIRLSVIDKI